MKKGDIVLIPFPFTDLTGNKNRPAVILVESEDDVIVCFITSQLKWQSAFDIVVQPTKLNGIKTSSLIRLSKLATIDKELIIGRLGVLDNQYTDQVNKNLIRLFKLSLS
jgi:mRNA interferase MazF